MFYLIETSEQGRMRKLRKGHKWEMQRAQESMPDRTTSIHKFKNDTEVMAFINNHNAPLPLSVFTSVAPRSYTKRDAGHAVAADVPVVGARFRNRGGILVITLPDGRQVKRVTIRPYKWASISERKGRDGKPVLYVRFVSTVGIEPVRAEIAREVGYRVAPLMIAQAI